MLNETRHPQLILEPFFLLHCDWHSGIVSVNTAKFKGLTTARRREKVSDVRFYMNEILVAIVMT